MGGDSCRSLHTVGSLRLPFHHPLKFSMDCWGIKPHGFSFNDKYNKRDLQQEPDSSVWEDPEEGLTFAAPSILPLERKPYTGWKLKSSQINVHRVIYEFNSFSDFLM